MPTKDHSTLNKPLKIATRGSQLALWQAEHVKGLLAKHGLAAEILVVKTTGDKVQDRFLHEMGGKGVFVREIEQTLLRGEADLAVHSLKDLPAVTPAPFRLSAILKRHASGDIVVFHPQVAERLKLARHSVFTPQDVQAWGKLVIGTGSLRRMTLLKQAASELEVVPIRGNVDTRLQKLRAHHWDAIVLAEASLSRLSLAEDLCKGTFDPQWFVPSSSQGALVVETLQDHPIAALLHEKLNCPETSFCVGVERGVLAGLGGDCTLPIGVHVSLASPQAIHCRAVVLNNHGQQVRVELEERGELTLNPALWSQRILEALLAEGVNAILSSLGIAPVQEGDHGRDAQ